MTQIKFGENLRYFRKKNGLTQRNLGEIIGVGQVAIANYEKGQRFPGERGLRDLVSALNISLDKLMGIELTPPQRGTGNFSRKI